MVDEGKKRKGSLDGIGRTKDSRDRLIKMLVFFSSSVKSLKTRRDEVESLLTQEGERGAMAGERGEASERFQS